MLRLPDKDLAAEPKADLQAWQALVDAKASFAEQVEEAKKQFKAKNVKTNRTFKAVRAALAQMHGDLVRCAYCEDSVADEVEHLYPKDIYPNRVFDWSNYAYACGPCNGPKNNQFALFLSTGGEQDVTPPKRKPAGWVATPPPPGEALLIDPRREDPFDFLWLDLNGTFRIDPVLGLAPKARRRAQYTCNLLGLNRDFLLKARRNALTMAWDSFRAYVALKAGGADQGELDKRQVAIQSMIHKTVWKEMIRQRGAIPVLKDAFQQAPEALLW